MKIEMNEKIYIAPKAKGKLFRKALVMAKELNLDELDVETLDKMMQFVVEVFGEKFDINDIYEHIDAEEMVQLAAEAIQHVTAGKKQDDNKKKIVEG